MTAGEIVYVFGAFLGVMVVCSVFLAVRARNRRLATARAADAGVVA